MSAARSMLEPQQLTRADWFRARMIAAIDVAYCERRRRIACHRYARMVARQVLRALDTPVSLDRLRLAVFYEMKNRNEQRRIHRRRSVQSPEYQAIAAACLEVLRDTRNTGDETEPA